MKSIWIACLCYLAIAPEGCFEKWIAESELHDQQGSPGWLSTKMDSLWGRVARTLVQEGQRRREALQKNLIEEIQDLPGGLELLDSKESEMAMQGTYDHLPTIRVDMGLPTHFPVPWSPPHRQSWYQVAKSAARFLKSLGKKEKEITAWKKLPTYERARQANRIAQLWNQVSPRFVILTRDLRYVENWIPILKQEWQSYDQHGRIPPGFAITSSIARKDIKMLEHWRTYLKPRRVLKPAYLPVNLDEVEAGVIHLPVVTDITDRKFLAEVEGALDTHWNQSPWAQKNGVSFHVTWSFIPRNKAFAAGKMDLNQHIERFPPEKAAITTGGLTHFVRNHVLILGPEEITPRTLAHELGHLMGFGDCYVKTLSGHGFFGLAILDWTNPLYPDDLMCDNNVGVPRAGVW